MLIKKEKDDGCSRVVVNTLRAVKMKYPKKLEMFTLYLVSNRSRCSSTLILLQSRIMTYYSLIMTHCSIRIHSWEFSSCREQILPLYKVCKENMIPFIFNLFLTSLGMFLTESQVTCVYCCTKFNTAQTAYLFNSWEEEGRGCYIYWG